MERKPHVVRRAAALAILAPICTMLAGCGPDVPFPLEPVTGKVTYLDGTLIPADEIRVRFEPQGLEAVGAASPRAAQGMVDVADGSFSELTTWDASDGVIVGKHKVVVLALKYGSHGVGEPTDAVPSSYGDPKTTPLEVEVTAGGDNHFELEVRKP